MTRESLTTNYDVIVGDASRESLAMFTRVANALRPRQPRRASIARLIAEAKKAGASSVTTPDGFTYALGQPSLELKTNAWDEVFDDPHAKRTS